MGKYFSNIHFGVYDYFEQMKLSLSFTDEIKFNLVGSNGRQ